MRVDALHNYKKEGREIQAAYLRMGHAIFDKDSRILLCNMEIVKTANFQFENYLMTLVPSRLNLPESFYIKLPYIEPKYKYEKEGERKIQIWDPKSRKRLSTQYFKVNCK